MRPSSHCTPSPPATAPQHPNLEAQQGKDNRLSHGASRPDSPVQAQPSSRLQSLSLPCQAKLMTAIQALGFKVAPLKKTLPGTTSQQQPQQKPQGEKLPAPVNSYSTAQKVTSAAAATRCTCTSTLRVTARRDPPLAYPKREPLAAEIAPDLLLVSLLVAAPKLRS